MKEHPFIEEARYKAFAALALVGVVAVQACFLFFYGEGTWWVVLSDSLASALVFAVLGYFAWYTVGLLDKLHKQIGIILLVQLVCLFASYLVLLSVSPESIDWFRYSLPLRILFGVLGWVILYQWYRWYLHHAIADETIDTTELSEDVAPESAKTILDRISVKDGTRIHLIPVEQLVYVEASGDYVTFFTTDKQYVKEQTMKSLMLQLPSGFIRIHRSVIVNCHFIARIELFEKHNYRIRLKNGHYLKVSAAGYRLLKEQLLL